MSIPAELREQTEHWSLALWSAASFSVSILPPTLSGCQKSACQTQRMLLPWQNGDEDIVIDSQGKRLRGMLVG